LATLAEPGTHAQHFSIVGPKAEFRKKVAAEKAAGRKVTFVPTFRRGADMLAKQTDNPRLPDPWFLARARHRRRTRGSWWRGATSTRGPTLRACIG
jgi:hypothetical protein